MSCRWNGPPDWILGVEYVNMGFFATVYELQDTFKDWPGDKTSGSGGYGVSKWYKLQLSGRLS